MSVVDASKPTYQLAGQGQLLVLKLHDGRLAAKGVEWRQGVAGLSDETPPGTKVGGRLGRDPCRIGRAVDSAPARPPGPAVPTRPGRPAASARGSAASAVPKPGVGAWDPGALGAPF
jgi:hypothetical protein